MSSAKTGNSGAINVAHLKSGCPVAARRPVVGRQGRTTKSRLFRRSPPISARRAPGRVSAPGCVTADHADCYFVAGTESLRRRHTRTYAYPTCRYILSSGDGTSTDRGCRGQSAGGPTDLQLTTPVRASPANRRMAHGRSLPTEVMWSLCHLHRTQSTTAARSPARRRKQRVVVTIDGGDGLATVSITAGGTSG